MAEDDADQSLISLKELSSVILGSGGTAYVLGLLALWVPAAKATQDFVMSWYAVALMSNTTVAGIGVRWFLVGPQLPLLVFLLAGYLLGWGLWSMRNAVGRWGLVSIGIGGIAVWLFFLAWTILHLQKVIQTFSGPPALRYILLLIILAAVFSPLILGFLKRESISRERIRRVLKYAALYLLTNFGTSLLVISLAGQLVLPVVEMRVQKNMKSDDIIGELWTHTDGFWYVFDRETDLCAIPDEDVQLVRIMKSGLAREDSPELTLCNTQ